MENIWTQEQIDKFKEDFSKEFMNTTMCSEPKFKITAAGEFLPIDNLPPFETIEKTLNDNTSLNTSIIDSRNGEIVLSFETILDRYGIYLSTEEVNILRDIIKSK